MDNNEFMNQNTNEQLTSNTAMIDPEYVTKAKKQFSAVGLGLFIFGMVSMLMGTLFNVIAKNIWPNDDAPGYLDFLIHNVSMYLIAFPILILFFKRFEKCVPERNKLKVSQFFMFIPMMATLVGLGAIPGSMINTLILRLIGGDMSKLGIIDLIKDSSFGWRTITVGILAPIVEEFCFRKFLIDRIVKYGELLAIVTSGLMFGLFHGNFAQAVFAAFIGAFFAYIYVRTGNVWYTILLHATVNLTTSIGSMYFISKLDLDLLLRAQTDMSLLIGPDGRPTAEYMSMLPHMMGFMAWAGFLGLIGFVGIVFWIISFKKIVILHKNTDLPKDKRIKAAYLNVGMILFSLFILYEFIRNYMITAM